MAKQPKGFGQPIKSASKKSSRPTTPAKSIALSLAPLKDTELIEEKEARLKQIFAPDPGIPVVSTASLYHYHRHLQTTFVSTLTLSSDEPFDWEGSYIYGRGTSQSHRIQRRQHPSYLDRFQFVTLSSEIHLSSGIQIEVQRLDDPQLFTLPLLKFKVDSFVNPCEAIEIADYQFWWRTYQPSFP
jgi:hypothetical protein